MWLFLLFFVVTGINAQEGPSVRGCCAYSIHLVNNYDKSNVWKVRVSGLCDTKICCATPDEWNQSGDASSYLEWTPPGGGPIPSGSAIDNDFMIFMSSAASPNVLQVEWLDFNNTVVCRHLITISCDGKYEEDQDWSLFTAKTPLDDPGLFVFAVREPEDDDEGCDVDEVNTRGACEINSNIMCAGSGTYSVSLSAPSGFTVYAWSVTGPSNLTLTETATQTVTITTPGTYEFTVTCAGQDSVEPCTSHLDVIIPTIVADFTYERVMQTCDNVVNFMAMGWLDVNTVGTVNWSCAGVSGFPTSGTNISFNFPNFGTYSVMMSIKDIYGCTYSITKTVDLSANCHAGLKVKEFNFCFDRNCSGTRDVTVTYQNTSTGGKCPLKFVWNFGDGTSVTTDQGQTTVQHTYHNVPCTGNSYSASIAMTDSSPTPCSSNSSIPANIMPCKVEIDFTKCSDGTVIFTSNVDGDWDCPGSVKTFGWPDAGNIFGWHHSKKVKYNTGDYTVTFKGYCDTGGTCTVVKSFHIDAICCSRNDRKHEWYTFSDPMVGTEYKMKYRFAQNQFPLVHRIKAKTKLKKCKKFLGVHYYASTHADEIEASFSGTIYKNSNPCACEIPIDVSQSETKYNAAKVKVLEHVGDKFRSRINSIHSVHRVVVAGMTVVKKLDLGQDCD